MFRCSWICGLFVVVFCVGCGPSNKPKFEKTVPVRGLVVLANGAPVRGGLITFRPQDPTKGEAWGMVGREGRFELGTYKKDDGAIPGMYTVTIEPVVYDRRGNLRPNKLLGIPAKYADAASSNLTVEVKDEGGQDLKLILR